MTITIVPHAPEWKAGTDEFNRRMRMGGSPWGFYVDAEPTWLPKKTPDQPTWREYWLAVEDGKTVRGAFALKPTAWLVHGQPTTVSDWQGPVSEGAISKQYSALGLRLIREMVKKQPLLHSWGHGGDEEPIVQLLRKLGWLMHSTPFALRITRPFEFLRKNRYLRNTPERRAGLDALAYSGLGTLGILGLHAALRARSGRVMKAEAEVVASFGGWADEVWHHAKGAYSALAVRDAAALNLVHPPGWTPHEWSIPTRLRVTLGGRTLGWIVVGHRHMKDDSRFGDLHVGTLYDYFAHPDDAAEVIGAGFRYLRRQNVDLVMANQSDPRWVHALETNGFAIVKNRRLFCAAPALAEKLAPFERTKEGLFLTNMDGHGPNGL